MSESKTTEKKERPRSPRSGAPLPEGRKFQLGDTETARKGGLKSVQVRAARKTLRNELLDLLEVISKDSKGNDHTQNEAISIALIKKARAGDVRAFETIRDTIGEKPKEQLEIATAEPEFSVLDAAFQQMYNGGEGN